MKTEKEWLKETLLKISDTVYLEEFETKTYELLENRLKELEGEE